MIHEEDLLALQTAILDAAVAKTSPGKSYLSLADFRQIVSQHFDQETLTEMLKELVGEGILEVGTGGAAQYSVTKEYLASIGDNH